MRELERCAVEQIMEKRLKLLSDQRFHSALEVVEEILMVIKWFSHTGKGLSHAFIFLAHSSLSGIT